MRYVQEFDRLTLEEPRNLCCNEPTDSPEDEMFRILPTTLSIFRLLPNGTLQQSNQSKQRRYNEVPLEDCETEIQVFRTIHIDHKVTTNPRVVEIHIVFLSSMQSYATPSGTQQHNQQSTR